jgi:hypothetical protein
VGVPLPPVYIYIGALSLEFKLSRAFLLRDRFYTKEVVFLRYIITLNRIKIDPTKIDIVLK